MKHKARTRGCGSETVTPAEHGPYCSRCCKPLEVGYRTALLTASIDRQGRVVSTEKIELTYRCPDGCASVAERWRLAAERFAEGWGEFTYKCSRCGTSLMGAPIGRPEGFWCCGCGSVEGDADGQPA